MSSGKKPHALIATNTFGLGARPGEILEINIDQFYYGRGLFPANDIRDVLANILAVHLGLQHKTITESIFPNIGEDYQSLPLFASNVMV